MLYTSYQYYAMVIALVIIYYILPKRFRWLALLAGSGFFYYHIFGTYDQLFVFVLSILISYLFALLIQKLKPSKRKAGRRLVLFAGILLSAAPLLAEKLGTFICGDLLHKPVFSWVVPVGLSFYTLQMVAYLVDVHKGKTDAQVNPLKYALFISFFPQLIQGPIPRYEQLGKELFEGHKLDFDNLRGGLGMIVWGFFLKFVIADKAAVIVNQIFDHHGAYAGLFILLAGVLYSFQLYADFLSCTTLAQGVAQLFGVRIADNFHRPYLSTSVKDFWRRWHMSLSFWLRDYIYIPLGGNRHGHICKWLFLLITFLVSGFWHGDGWKFLAWGLLHAVYQIIGDIVHLISEKIKLKKVLPKDTLSLNIIRRIWTFLLIMIGWIVFRADTLDTAIEMLKSMVTTFNPWVLFDDSLFSLGLSWKECIVLLAALLLLWYIGSKQEKGIQIRAWVAKRSFFVRWALILGCILAVWVFGTYGFGFDANAFIYGGF